MVPIPGANESVRVEVTDAAGQGTDVAWLRAELNIEEVLDAIG